MERKKESERDKKREDEYYENAQKGDFFSLFRSLYSLMGLNNI